MPSKTKATKDSLKPSEVLCASIVLDPRYEELYGRVMREAISWPSVTPEVALGMLLGVHRVFGFMESMGKGAAFQMLAEPKSLPEDFPDPNEPPQDLDGMDV